LVIPTAKFKFCVIATPPPPPPKDCFVSALVLIEPELLGTNNSGPLSPTKVGCPCCTVPPPANSPGVTPAFPPVNIPLIYFQN